MYELTLLLHELYLLPLLALSPLILAMLGALKLFECTPGNFSEHNTLIPEA